MIRLPSTQIALTPDDIQSIEIRLKARREALKATQSGVRPATNPVPESDVLAPLQGQGRSRPSPASAMTIEPHGTVERSRGRLWPSPASSQSATRPLRTRLRSALRGTGLDGSQNPSTHRAFNSDGSVDDDGLDVADMDGSADFGSRDTSSIRNASYALNSQGFDDDEDEDEDGQVFRISRNVTIRTHRHQHLTSSESLSNTSIVDDEALQGPHNDRFSSTDDHGSHISTSSAPELRDSQEEELDMSLDIVQTDLSRRLDLQPIPRASSFPESYIRHSSTLSSSPPASSSIYVSQTLPRSRPSDRAERQPHHGVHARSPLSMTYILADASPSPSESSAHSHQHADTQAAPNIIYESEDDGNQSASAEDEPPQHHALRSLSAAQGAYHRGGNPRQDLHISTELDHHDLEVEFILPNRRPQAHYSTTASTSEIPSSPPLPIHSSSASFYSFSDQGDDQEDDLPIHSSPPQFSSPQLPSPYRDRTFQSTHPHDPSSPLGNTSLLIPPSTSSSAYRQNASLLHPQESSVVDSLYRNPYRRRTPLPRHPARDRDSSPSPPPRTRTRHSPSPSLSSSPPPLRRSLRIYNDRLPASSQPQTPSRREITPYNPAFTAPARVGEQGYRYITPIGARRRMRRMERRRGGRSGSPVAWDEWASGGEEAENASVDVEAERWVRRVLGEREGRRGVDDEGEGEGEGGLQRTPERLVRMGAGVDPEMV